MDRTKLVSELCQTVLRPPGSCFSLFQISEPEHMKLRLLDLLVCPECRGPLSVEAARTETLTFASSLREAAIARWKQAGLGADALRARWEACCADVAEGEIGCASCGTKYPIERGVPRLLPPSLRTSLGMARGEATGEVLLPGPMDQIAPVTAAEDRELFDRIQMANQTNYGYEWQAFAHEYDGWEENYRRYYLLEQPAFFSGKLGIDGGCGMGRYSLIPVRWGAEVVGVDLSNAIDMAYEKSRTVPTFHAVQGDLFNLPFRDDQFDFCQSLGVIHITPDPEGALQSLRRVVKPGGKLFVMVYTDFDGEDAVKHSMLKVATWMRRFTIKLKPETLYKVLGLALPIVIATFYLPSALLWKVGARRMSSRFAYSYEQYRNRRFRDIHMNMFDRFGNPVERRYNRREMIEWLDRSGLESPRLEHRDSWMFAAAKPHGNGR